MARVIEKHTAIKHSATVVDTAIYWDNRPHQIHLSDMAQPTHTSCCKRCPCSRVSLPICSRRHVLNARMLLLAVAVAVALMKAVRSWAGAGAGQRHTPGGWGGGGVGGRGGMRAHPARLKLAAGAVAEQLPAGAGGGGNGGGTGAGAPGAGLLDDLVIRLDPQLQRLRQLLLAHQTLRRKGCNASIV